HVGRDHLDRQVSPVLCVRDGEFGRNLEFGAADDPRQPPRRPAPAASAVAVVVRPDPGAAIVQLCARKWRPYGGVPVDVRRVALFFKRGREVVRLRARPGEMLNASRSVLARWTGPCSQGAIADTGRYRCGCGQCQNTSPHGTNDRWLSPSNAEDDA